MKKRRSIGLTMVAIFLIILGLIGQIVIFLLSLLDNFNPINIWHFISLLPYSAVPILTISSGIGILMLKKWARKTGMIVIVLHFVFILLWSLWALSGFDLTIDSVNAAAKESLISRLTIIHAIELGILCALMTSFFYLIRPKTKVLFS
ncbi:MAG: hypothetical protein KBD53_07460 [Candidatus Omnitrophica bacterium]|nr:hypothetical protein [Candidatus Omnitrophota bacterium]